MIRAPSFTATRTPPTTESRSSPDVESQRQHVRVRMPGFIELEANGARQRAKLHDLSAGGCSFDLPRNALKPGQALRSSIVITSEPIGFTLPATLQVRSNDASGRVGCRFQDLGPRETGALRQLIGSTLSGDTLSVGDVMRPPAGGAGNGGNGGTVIRPRTSRPAPTIEHQGFGQRLRALVVSVVALTLGVTAFGYALKQIHKIMFVTT